MSDHPNTPRTMFEVFHVGARVRIVGLADTSLGSAVGRLGTITLHDPSDPSVPFKVKPDSIGENDPIGHWSKSKYGFWINREGVERVYD